MLLVILLLRRKVRRARCPHNSGSDRFCGLQP